MASVEFLTNLPIVPPAELGQMIYDSTPPLDKQVFDPTAQAAGTEFGLKMADMMIEDGDLVELVYGDTEPYVRDGQYDLGAIAVDAHHAAEKGLWPDSTAALGPLDIDTFRGSFTVAAYLAFAGERSLTERAGWKNTEVAKGGDK